MSAKTYTVVVANKGDHRVRAIGPTSCDRHMLPARQYKDRHDYVGVVRWEDREITVRTLVARQKRAAAEAAGIARMGND